MIETEPVNIAAHLPAMAKRQPHRAAVVVPSGRDAAGRVAYTHLTFAQLDAESNRIARGLESIGIRRGTRTALMVPPSLDFFALTFALFKVGAVPVLIDPGMGIRNLKQCLAEAEPEAFIGIPKAHLARVLLRWARSSLRIHVTVGRRYLWGGWTLAQVRERGGDGAWEMADSRADETAAILFTSGSTGPPKGAVYTHGVFGAQVRLLKEIYGIEPGEIDCPTFPLFALFDPALGMTAVIPDMDPTRPARVNPERILEPIRDFGVTNMFGSPALLRQVARYGVKHRVRCPSLRRVISAGAPVPADVLEQFASMLGPGAEIHTPYGATESLPVATIGSDEILNETRRETEAGGGVCVGRPVPGMTVRIIRIQDEAIPSWSDDLLVPEGEVGEITVAGPVVTESYYNRPQKTAEAKIREESKGRIVHRMGDVGRFDEEGRLWFCGRKAHRVETSEGCLYTVPCEAVFNRHERVYRTALVGVGPEGEKRPVLCVELESSEGDPEAIREELLAMGQQHEHTAGIETILFCDRFPVDIRHNAKIFREKLAVWAADRVVR